MDAHSSDCTHLHGTTASYVNVSRFVFLGCFIRCLKVVIIIIIIILHLFLTFFPLNLCLKMDRKNNNNKKSLLWEPTALVLIYLVSSEMV